MAGCRSKADARTERNGDRCTQLGTQPCVEGGRDSVEVPWHWAVRQMRCAVRAPVQLPEWQQCSAPSHRQQD